MENLAHLSGIGPKTLQKLSKLGIGSSSDLLFHFPHRYIDFSNTSKIKDIQAETNVTLKGEMKSFQNIFTRGGKNIQKALVSDGTGTISIIWFNQSYLSTVFKVGETYSFAGTVEEFKGRFTLISPEYGPYNTGKIIAVYPETQGLSSKWFRKTIQLQLDNLLANIEDFLPQTLLDQHQLFGLHDALKEIHSPTNQEKLNKARFRLSLDEVIYYQTKSYLLKKQWETYQPKYLFKSPKTIEKKITNLIDSLPFTLTTSQHKVWGEIQNDLLKKVPMNRLLQGDVGSGKTIIAILAAYLAHLNNTISVIVAPTEILARQHYSTFKKYLQDSGINLHLATSTTKLQKETINKNDIIIGTHAAIYHKHIFDKHVGLLIIDEQHKFGVEQRNFLHSSTKAVHTLTMTATPIPRTISMTLMGNLDLSVITELPKDRQPIKTFLVPVPKIRDCYHWIEKNINETNCQAYIVCPLIEESETLITVKSAKKEFEHLSHEVFPKLKLALIHGKTNPKERQQLIQQFLENKIQVLVTTPIIEVGVDIPNSSIIVIQSADRFGLAQLHQLRGRVGRGSLQSYCYLFTESTNDKSQKRLQFLSTHTNGLDISEYDLKTRGPGSAFSLKQHGFLSLKLADLSDLELISTSQNVLQDLIDHYPDFNLSQLLKEESSSLTVLPS